jgi:hypothetical protein
VLLVAVPPLLVAYLQGLSPLPEERRLDALPGDVGSGELTSPQPSPASSHNFPYCTCFGGACEHCLLLTG